MINNNTEKKNALIEGVSFCFYKDNKILLEDRGEGFRNKAIFPSGKIESKDKISSDNYHETALLREISEEFNSKIKIVEYQYLGEQIIEEYNVLFYVYVITKWEGTFPKVIVELNKKDSKIDFFNIKEVESMLKNEDASKTLDMVKKYLNEKDHKLWSP